jgi:hypothetical protein
VPWAEGANVVPAFSRVLFLILKTYGGCCYDSGFSVRETPVESCPCVASHRTQLPSISTWGMWVAPHITHVPWSVVFEQIRHGGFLSSHTYWDLENR